MLLRFLLFVVYLIHQFTISRKDPHHVPIHHVRATASGLQ